MITKRTASRSAVTLGLILAASVGLAFAYGWGGHARDGSLPLLARAAGVSRSTIASTFHGNTTLQNDFSALHSMHQTAISCLVSSAVTSSGGCTSAISAYATAQAKMTTDKMTAWQTVFAGAPNLSNATTVLGELQSLQAQEKNLREQRHQILKAILGPSAEPTP